MINQQEINSHVARVIASESFRHSPTVAKLLLFCVDAGLKEDHAALKETTIGVWCFGRPAGYDTKADPIVRVNAGRLRSKLDLFYRQEGAQEEIRISLPKGSYVPAFHRHLNVQRTVEVEAEDETVPLSQVELVSSPVLAERRYPASSYLAFVMTAAVILLGVLLSSSKPIQQAAGGVEHSSHTVASVPPAVAAGFTRTSPVSVVLDEKGTPHARGDRRHDRSPATQRGSWRRGYMKTRLHKSGYESKDFLAFARVNDQSDVASEVAARTWKGFGRPDHAEFLMEPAAGSNISQHSTLQATPDSSFTVVRAVVADGQSSAFEPRL